MRDTLIAVLLLSLLIAPARAQVSPRLTPSSIADGGASVKAPARLVPAVLSGGGTFSLEGAIGQPLAGESSGGMFTLRGGSLAISQPPFIQAVVRASGNPAL
jgi:hypothetical protein